MKPGLSGYTVCRNAISLDYPLVECILSMLPVCDEVVVCDSDSEDGTVMALELLASIQPKIRIINRPFDNPKGDEGWFDRWVNFARGHLQYDMQLQMDADEIVHPCSYDEIRASVARRDVRLFTFHNFWLDAQHTCPWGDGKKLHLLPTELYLNSHGARPDGEVNARQLATEHPTLVSLHYSALRKREAYYAKCRFLGEAMIPADADITRDDPEKSGMDLMHAHPDRLAACVPFRLTHPEFMHKWLTERGWKIQ